MVVTVHEDLYEGVTKRVGPRGIDVVYDPVGGPLSEASARLLAVEGRLLIVGFASGRVPDLKPNHALLKNYSVVGFRTRPFRDDPAYRAEVHQQLLDWYDAGKLAPMVEPVAFDEVPAGLRRMGAGEISGRLVVQVNGTEHRKGQG